MMPQPTEQCVQIVLISWVLLPVEFAASAYYIITGDTVVASAAPPAIRLEFLRNARRESAPGTATETSCLVTSVDVLVNLFISIPRLNVSRLVVIEHVLG
jgi:hypothetical protein